MENILYRQSLPVVEVLPELKKVLASHCRAVLAAPPGSGKTTGVPVALLKESWLAGRSILVLEPRRLAARLAAGRMAWLLGEEVGETVGYAIRFERKVSKATRIEVVTEGILTRRLQHDPSLEGVGAVLFDEFHERSIHADLGLAFCLDVQQGLRDDLRLLVMSATLEVERVAGLLGDGPAVIGGGRSFPVEVVFELARRKNGSAAGYSVQDIAARTAAATRRALAEQPGDILVFLPGSPEIRAVEKLLRADVPPGNREIMPLYGNLPKERQEEAIRPSAEDRRKIVLATPIAETSLTIEGITTVVDSGWMKAPRFDPNTGLSRLLPQRISKASAKQRAGRAGRLGPGVCYRLWSKHEHFGLKDHTDPEILSADLAPLALELANWGIAGPHQLSWLDPPPEGHYRQAVELLCALGALDEKGAVTPIGRRMAALPLHPRLAHMLLAACGLGLGGLACRLAALIDERDVVLYGREEVPADLEYRLHLLETFERKNTEEVRRFGGNVSILQRVSATVLHLASLLGQDRRQERHKSCDIGRLLAFAYPDRIAALREGSRNRYLLASGRGAMLPDTDPLCASPFLVAASLDAGLVEGRIYLAASLQERYLEKDLARLLVHEKKAYWDEQRGIPVMIEEIKLGALTLRSKKVAKPDRQLLAGVLLDAVRASNLALLPWTGEARRFQARICCLRDWMPEEKWPDLSDATLCETLEEWLLPFLEGAGGRQELRRLNLGKMLRSTLDWRHLQLAEELAPERIVVPSGSKKKVEYAVGEAPILAVRLQEMFGLADTPRICRDRVPLTLHLLSPAQRPIQVTRDLKGFWDRTYAEVKKELKGRYPRHHWPDDPWRAQPTTRAKPRGRKR